ncbi:amidase family protein [Egbenema bharatensis]|uniref:amidase family protein n=1 Tax=Egbenema bharatensis TaxID=3463334 RepID=UPI003A85F0EE
MPITWTAQQIRSALLKRELSATEFTQDCLDRIQQREPIVGAWESLNPDRALHQAKEADVALTQSQSGLLQGIPIAIKDIFATVDYPTGWGTPIHAGKWLGYDAAVVERLRSAGAIIMGKTVTTEYATAKAGKTRNPHHPDHTPGGSSSGSAAAVADGMVPVAIGSQTLHYWRLRAGWLRS